MTLDTAMNMTTSSLAPLKKMHITNNNKSYFTKLKLTQRNAKHFSMSLRFWYAMFACIWKDVNGTKTVAWPSDFINFVLGLISDCSFGFYSLTSIFNMDSKPPAAYSLQRQSVVFVYVKLTLFCNCFANVLLCWTWA